MIKYEDILREITVLSNKKIRNEERIQQLNEQNNSISSSLKILTSKKEMFEKLNSDLESVMRKKKKSTKKADAANLSSGFTDDGDENLASNVFWPQSDRKHGF